MAIRVVCPECQSTYSVADELRGKKGRCRQCNASFRIDDAPLGRETTSRVRRERTAEDEAEEPRSSKPRKPRKRANVVMPLVIVGGTIITVLAAVGAGVGVWTYMKSRDPAPHAGGPAAGNGAAPGGATAAAQHSFWTAALPPFANRGAATTPDLEVEAPPAEPPGDDPPASPDKKPNVTPATAMLGQLAPEVVQKVKLGTFYLRVTMANDQKGTGSGFLADESGIVVTNAHVLGMLARDGQRPKLIEVFVHSGEKREKKVNAELLGLDRRNDLALLRIPKEGLPPPLTVKSAETLLETQPLWISGFPYGEGLGKNVTLNESRVSSLRKENGVLTRVQVHGDMQPGNSGGPVVDAQGDVVAVSVAIIRQTRINFAIPGDSVLDLFNGRFAQMTLGVPYKDGDQVRLPITVRMQDPLQRIRKVAVDLWTGDPGRDRPPSRTAPAGRRSDGTRTQVALTYEPKTGQSEGTLTPPELLVGRVCWLQPAYEDGRGITHWADGRIYQAPPPVERKPAVLGLRPTGQERPVTLRQETNLRLGYTLEGLYAIGVKMETRWKESMHPGDGPDSWEARRQYANLTLAARYNRGSPQDSPLPAKLAGHLDSLRGKLRLDGDLHARNQEWGADLAKVDASVRPQLLTLHTLTQRTLDLLALPLPGTQLAPGATWKPNGPRTLHLETFDIGHAGSTSMEWTFTYAGLRQRDGREEAVVQLAGALRDAGETFQDAAGSASGLAILDPASGQVTRLEAQFDLDFATNWRGFNVPVRGATTIRLEAGAPAPGN